MLRIGIRHHGDDRSRQQERSIALVHFSDEEISVADARGTGVAVRSGHAATDPDQDNGIALFRCSSPGLDPVDVLATEQDNTPDARLTVTVNEANVASDPILQELRGKLTGTTQ